MAIRKAKVWHFLRLHNGTRINVQNYDRAFLGRGVILSDDHKEFGWLTC